MKIRTLLLVALVLVGSKVYANDGEYTIGAEYTDFNPNDGFMDPGTFSNPYVVQEHGRTVYEISPSSVDFNPGDGFMDAGSSSNPYKIKKR